ncbi:shikimate kinase [Clostridium sp.]|uniref:shikimate kinase n=1 Tax=Clostridium sp. TaxID=1506 RepID=UPI003463AEEF
MKNIILIGMSGCGKTTVGKALSENLGMKFMDTDDEIEKKEGISTSNIFKLKGEKYFRKVEKNLIEEISALENTVIATGGGMAVFEDNINKLNEIGYTIFLRVKEEVFLERILEDRKRPLAMKGREYLIELYLSRVDKYLKAHKIVDCENKDIDFIVNEIIKILGK